MFIWLHVAVKKAASNCGVCFFAAFLLCSLLPLRVAADQQSWSLTYYRAITPFNDVDVAMNALRWSRPLNQTKWVDGVSVIYGRYEGIWEFGDTNWYALGPYWTLWSSEYGKLNLEFAPTYIDQRFMAGHEVGSNWHFTSALEYSLPLRFLGAVDLGFRYQHTSNAGIGSPNPGIDSVGLFIQASFK